MMDFNITDEELNALKNYKEKNYEAINQMLVSNAETDIALLSSEVENKVVTIMYDRVAVIEYLKSIKLIYSLILKSFYGQKRNNLKKLYRGTNLSEIERVKSELFIDRMLSTTDNKYEAINFYSANWNRPACMNITLEENIPYIVVRDVLKDKKYRNEILVSPFTKIKYISEEEEQKIEKNVKASKVYNIELEKQHLDELSERERDGLYQYVLENAYYIKKKLVECIELEQENAVNFENIRKLEQLLSKYENEIEEKEEAGQKDIDYDDIDRITHELKELKKVSTSLFEVRKENINFINMWKRNIAVYMIAECKEIEKRFEMLTPEEEKDGVNFVAESYMPENLVENEEVIANENVENVTNLANKNVAINIQNNFEKTSEVEIITDIILDKLKASVAEEKINELKDKMDVEENPNYIENVTEEVKENEVEETQEDTEKAEEVQENKVEEISEKVIEEMQEENKKELNEDATIVVPIIDNNVSPAEAEVILKAKNECDENVKTAEMLLANIKELITKQQNHAKIAGNIGSVYSALNNAFEMKKVAENLLELIKNISGKVNEICTRTDYPNKIEKLGEISSKNIQINTLFNYLNNPKIATVNSKATRFDEMAIIEENELKRGIAERIRTIRGEAELKKLKDDLEIIEDKGTWSRLLGFFTGQNKLDEFLIEQIEIRQLAIRRTLSKNLSLAYNYSIHDLVAEITMFVNENEDDELVRKDVNDLKVLADELRKNFVIIEGKVQSIVESKEGKNLLLDNKKISKKEILEIETYRFLNKYGYDLSAKTYNEEPKYQDTMASEISRIVEYINSARIL